MNVFRGLGFWQRRGEAGSIDKMPRHVNGENRPQPVETEPFGGFVADDVGNAGRHSIRFDRGCEVSSARHSYRRHQLRAIFSVPPVPCERSWLTSNWLRAASRAMISSS